MNVRVEASSINVDFISKLYEPVIITENYTFDIVPLSSTWTCFTLTQTSINGHSISAINPEFLQVGELAASLA